MSETKRGPRLALTKKQSAAGLGLELLELSRSWLADGKIEPQELDQLKAWLDKVPADALPAIAYLKEQVQEIVADGEVDEWELGHLQTALIRIIPPADREAAKAARSEVALREWEARAPERAAARENSLELSRRLREEHGARWAGEPATDAQRAYAESLGGSLPANASKLDASKLIECLLTGEEPQTPPQSGPWLLVLGIAIAAVVVYLVR